jgi:hypothetical protein
MVLTHGCQRSASTVPVRTGHRRGPGERVSTGDVGHLFFFYSREMYIGIHRDDPESDSEGGRQWLGFID